MIHPVVELRLRRLAHAVALVSEVPRGNGLVVLEGVDEMPDEPRLPHDGLRVCEDVPVLEHRRDELPSRHPARHDADDEPDAVLLRDVAEVAEPTDHDGVNSRLVGKRPVVAEAEGSVPAAGVAVARKRLEVAP